MKSCDSHLVSFHSPITFGCLPRAVQGERHALGDSQGLRHLPARVKVHLQGRAGRPPERHRLVQGVFIILITIET